MGKFGGKSGPTGAEPDLEETRNDALVEAVLGARVYVDVTIPRTQVAGKMRLLSRAERRRVIAEARKTLAAAGFPVDGNAVLALGASDEWNVEIAVRTLALAVRDPKATDLALGTLEDWHELDDEQIGPLWSRYQDLGIELDPLAEETPLTQEDLAAIRAAVKKNEIALLMSFGSLKLARYAITSADPPAT